MIFGERMLKITTNLVLRNSVISFLPPFCMWYCYSHPQIICENHVYYWTVASENGTVCYENSQIKKPLDRQRKKIHNLESKENSLFISFGRRKRWRLGISLESCWIGIYKNCKSFFIYINMDTVVPHSSFHTVCSLV